MRWVALTLLLSSSLVAQTNDDLVGLWGVEANFGPQIRGPFTLERSQSVWTLRAGGFEVTAPANGDELRIAVPGGLGELRGSVASAFWIQPATNLVPHATPVKLEAIGSGAWRGVITPLDDRFSLYLPIAREADGSLRGSFHNPEMNWNGRAAWFRIERGAESIQLIDPSTGKARFVQPYDPGQRRIAMEFGTPIALAPRTREQAVGFVPRSPSAAPYRYRIPLDLRDGWKVARASAVGLDEELLRQLVERIAGVDPSDHVSPRIHSVVIARHGRLVLDEYFYGYSADRPHDLRSASKTFTSMMAGIAMDRVPSFTIHSPIDPRHPDITLGHLLTHSSGLDCDDNDDHSPGNESTMQTQTRQPDWLRYFADLPVVRPPGTKYAYCSGGMNMALGMVGKATQMWLPELFERFVARPLQMGLYHVNLTPTGDAYGGGGIYMRPRDLIKLGQTYLDGGVWNGRRVVSQAWVKTSTARQIDNGGAGDGYGWHLNTLRLGDREYRQYEANGNGGQYVMVIPELDLVVAFTAGNYNRYPIWKTFREELVPRYVMAGSK